MPVCVCGLMLIQDSSEKTDWVRWQKPLAHLLSKLKRAVTSFVALNGQGERGTGGQPIVFLFHVTHFPEDTILTWTTNLVLNCNTLNTVNKMLFFIDLLPNQIFISELGGFWAQLHSCSHSPLYPTDWVFSGGLQDFTEYPLCLFLVDTRQDS